MATESVNRRVNAMGIGVMSEKELRAILNAIVDALGVLADAASKTAEVNAIIKKG